MIILTCPSCKTKYKHKDDALKMGDSVQCSVCTYDWIVSSRNAKINKSSQFSKVNEKLRDIRNQNRKVSNINFIISGVAIILLTFVFAKNKIAQTFPITKDIYYITGLLDRPVKNKVFVMLTYNGNKIINKENALVIKGVIRNNLKKKLSNPKIKVELLNNNGDLVEARKFKFNFTISPKKTEVFRMVVKKPNIGTAQVKLKYIE